MGKGRLIMAGLVMVLSLTACGRTKEKAYDVSTIVLEDDGSIREYIVEAFDESIYSIEELKNLIQTETAACEAEVTLEDIRVEEGVARVQLTYAMAEDYAEFNGEVFYAGTYDNVATAGQDLIPALEFLTDEGELKSSELSGRNICIWESAHEIRVSGKILFSSKGVELLNDHCAAIRDGSYGYVIYE